MSGESEPGGVTSAELSFLRAVLLRLDWGRWSSSEFADAAGLSVLDAARASESLVRCGALIDRPGYALSPSFEHESSRELAARAGETPICWAQERNAPRDPREVRANIDHHVRLWGDIRGERARRFDALEGDVRRAAMLLRVGVSGFGSLLYWSRDLVDAAYLFEPSVWLMAAECFADGSLRKEIGQSIAVDRTLPGLPPMLIVDHSRTNCSVCRLSALWDDDRHLTEPGYETPLRRACGVAWTHYTIRPWLAELNGWVAPDGEVRNRMEPLRGLPHLKWLDP